MAVVQKLTPIHDPEAVFLRLASLPHCLFLDSAMRLEDLGRYSFVCADPFRYLELKPRGLDELSELETVWREVTAGQTLETLEGLPPFQGGVAGLFSYDLGYSLESIPKPHCDEFQVPSLAVGFYDVVVAFDHHQKGAWIISQGLPEQEPIARANRALERAAFFQQILSAPIPVREPHDPDPEIGREALAPQFEVRGNLTSNFSREAYLEAVQKCIDYIYAGDVFQVNLSQRLLHPATVDSVELYMRLRHRNPATFAGYFATDEFEILSASPERFLQVRDSVVEARPIKGTRARVLMPEADLYAAEELRQSEKDRAENVMIVDLLRNDLSPICEPESVFVKDLCRLEVYQFVQHLVSVVEGRMRPDKTPFDLIRQAFPGGSITGAPKVRAMEIISELEPTARGPYCGSLGYVGFDGSMDLSILIRTITAGKGWWQFPVGGGIVAQSNPEREYVETWEKATGMLKALA
ncbi:MAG: aminodeoxychorismate/anthranilate synthase component I [Rhodopirellula sp.]|nr:aminodeoxychorismate/anthranilate synthase component I [Rhodopirellula sp.]|tara:strand:+ start:34389 stop:35789 length:1401 start_codon:yes stop_codon:yes gene_type:complete